MIPRHSRLSMATPAVTEEVTTPTTVNASGGGTGFAGLDFPGVTMRDVNGAASRRVVNPWVTTG